MQFEDGREALLCHRNWAIGFGEEEKLEQT